MKLERTIRIISWSPGRKARVVPVNPLKEWSPKARRRPALATAATH